MMSALTFVLCVTNCPIPADASGQPIDPELTLGFKRTLRSVVLDEDRELLVYLPSDYEMLPNRRYPLLVVLDARGSFKPTAALVHTLSGGGAIPRMIVVAIKNTNRWRDLLPMPAFGIPGSGGGSLFLTSLSTEIVPWIDAHFRTNGFRVFSGHSLGGLTVLNALRQSPDLFDAYIALSPSLEAAEGAMGKSFEVFLEEAPRSSEMLYLAIADEAMERPYYDEFVKLLEQAAPRQWFWRSQAFEEEDDHMSIRISGGLAGLRWVFRDWRLSSRRIYSMSDEELERHYAMASQRYKEKRSLDMMAMTDAAYWGLYDPEKRARAMKFFRRAVSRWPNLAYPYSCLGEGLERSGDLEGALVEMEKALAMAEKEGHPDLPYFQGMIERVERELARRADAEVAPDVPVAIDEP